jgi:hypothetical protein
MPTFVEQEGAITSTVDVSPGGLIEKRTQDVQPILDANRALANEGRGFSASGDMKRVATIPLIVVEQWLKEGFDIYDPGNSAALMRRLRDGQWSKLRTSEGGV